MGWLIIAILFLILGIFLVVISDKLNYRWDETICFLGVSTTLISFFTALILICFMISEKTEDQVTIDQYNNTVELIQNLGVPSEAIMTEIIKTNDKILEHRVKSNKFMTKGLYSKKVAALPLLETPEVMKVSPIDYE